MNSNISVTGNIGREPEIKFGAKSAVTSLSVAVTPRQKVGTEWVDMAPLWFKAVFFGAKAEEVVDTYGKGQRVKLTGQLTIGQPWTDKQGVHHDGGYEINNAEVELAPWESKPKTDTSPPESVQKSVQNTQVEVAPF